MDNSLYRAPLTGLFVGVTDVALVFPLAVLATRRECGDSFRQALRKGRFWSGGMTAGTLLVPYSICVESVSTYLDDGGGSGVGLLAVLGTTCVTTLGVQPIEKKLVMDQMLQNSGAALRASKGRLTQPIHELAAYTSTHGLANLYGGFMPLLARELCYITAITAVNPAVTGWLFDKGAGRWYGVSGAFSVGVCAGIVSAPFQTVSAMQKSEVHRGVRLRQILQAHVFSEGAVQGFRRLFFGAGIRSCRTGCAGVLYYCYRSLFTPDGS